MGALLSALLAAFAPVLEQLIAGLGTDLVNLICGWLSGVQSVAMPVTTADVTAKAQEVVTAAERITGSVTTDPAAAMAFVTSQYPTYADLEAAMPGMMQSIQAKHILMGDTGVPHSIAAHVVQVGYANQRVAAAAKP